MGKLQYLCPICGGAEMNTEAEKETVCIVRGFQPWYKGDELKDGDVVEGKYDGYGVVPFGQLKLLCRGLHELGQYDAKEKNQEAVLVDMYCQSCYTTAPQHLRVVTRELKELADKMAGVTHAIRTQGVKRKRAPEAAADDHDDGPMKRARKGGKKAKGKRGERA